MAHAVPSIMPRVKFASRLLGRVTQTRQRRRGVCGRARSVFHPAVSPAFRGGACAGGGSRRHQKRAYSVSPTEDSNDEKGSQNAIFDDVDGETMERHNILSRRLYRALLRSCKRGVEISNRGNSIDSDDGKSWLLLQPPMDQRKYGFAKIVFARRGRKDLLPRMDFTRNRATMGMTKEEVGMAMEVLQFSLGGDADSNLATYFLGCADGHNIDDQNQTGVGVDHVDDVGDSNNNHTSADDMPNAGSAAGHHSEGHYTDFIDDDKERGERDNDDNVKAQEGHERGQYKENEWESDGEEDADTSQGIEFDESILVTSDDLRNAARIAFCAPLMPTSKLKEEMQPLSTTIARRHRDAINAFSRFSEQLKMWGDKSSLSVDWERGVRVAATSALMMLPGSATQKYRFSYRIRVENVADVLDSNEVVDPRLVERRAVQLLGRTWNILEQGPWHKTSSSVLCRFLEEGVIPSHAKNKSDATDGGGDDLRVVQTVNEPRTGAVGYLPVLGPGEVFEYTSGADISTTTGAMEGCFHMASVDMQNTSSAVVGDHVEALQLKPDDERRFEMPIGKFGLVVDDP